MKKLSSTEIQQIVEQANGVPLRFHDFCNPRDYEAVAECIAVLLPLWAAEAGVSVWTMTWRFQQRVRQAGYAKPK